MFVRWQVAGITLQKVESSLRPGRPCHCIMLELVAAVIVLVDYRKQDTVAI
jgi:hypothetical protein